MDSTGSCNTIHAGHHDIHQDHIRRSFETLLKNLLAAIHCAHQFNIWMYFKKSRQAQPHGGVVINNQHANTTLFNHFLPYPDANPRPT